MSHVAPSPRVRLSGIALSVLLAFGVLPLLASPVAATDVDTEAEFRTAWANADETLITLTANITYNCVDPDSAPTRASSTDIVIDGAGFTLHNPCTFDALQASTGKVTLRNLTLTGNDTSARGLSTNGDVVVEQDSRVTDHGSHGIVAFNGELEAGVTVTDSTISDNGREGIQARFGDVTVSGSIISGNGEGGIVVGGNPFDIVGRNVTVSDSEISGNVGSESDCADGINASGNVMVTDGSTISGNGDVGILADGEITVIGSEVSGNGVVHQCGAGGIDGGSDIVVTNSIVSENLDRGVAASGDATVTDSTISDNGDDDDGIQASGDAIVTRSTISGNSYNGITADGDAIVTDSTITANAVDGVYAGTVTVNNSTITDNAGAGIFAELHVFATHATITGNNVNIQNPLFDTIHLYGTVLLEAEEANCDGLLVEDEGYNFVDDDSCGDIAANTADPQLGELADNGGPTETRLPDDDSPLVDAIPVLDCEETTEQRGLFLRPQGPGCDIGSVEIEPNTPPVAVPDAYSVQKDTTLNVAAPGVLGNDTDVDGDPLTAVKVTDPSNGTLTLNANGSFTYVPDAGFVGADSFTYKANDGAADSNVATVTITVTVAPVQPTPTPSQQVLADTTVALSRSSDAWIGFAMAVLLLTGIVSSAMGLWRKRQAETRR